MPVHTMRLGFILLQETFRVERPMLFCAHGQQMIRINTAPVLAPEMEHCSLGNRAMAVFPENSVRIALFAADFH